MFHILILLITSVIIVPPVNNVNEFGSEGKSEKNYVFKMESSIAPPNPAVESQSSSSTRVRRKLFEDEA
jgi:hypothetical protein